MKGTDLHTEINRLQQVIEKPQHTSSHNLRNVRKRLARLRKQAKHMLAKHKIEVLKYGKQLSII